MSKVMKKNKVKKELSSVYTLSMEQKPNCGLSTFVFKKKKKRISDHRNHSTVEGNHLIKVCGGETHQTQIFLLKIKMEMELFK